MSRRAILLALAALLGGCFSEHPAEPDDTVSFAADVELVLNGSCAFSNCHGTTGTAQGSMPSLAGQQKTYIVEQMKAFRDGKRPATVMHQLAKGYTDQQIELIADYYSRQKPAR